MRKVRIRRSRVDAIEVVALGLLGVACLALAVIAETGDLPRTFPDAFARGELIGWMLLALVTGGLMFGARDRRPPLLASGLVGSAALLGAGPLACAAIGAAGAIGGLRRLQGLVALRVLGAAVVASAIPGLLVVAAQFGGPTLRLEQPLPVASIVALWVAFAIVLPVIESCTTRLVFTASERIDPLHMIARRLEPQSVLAALAVLAAITYAALGPVAGLIVLVPAAAASAGFALHDDGRRAVSQTLAAMTVLPEWVGMVEAGHTGRVRETVQRVCLDLRLESRLRRDIVRAAELHELGHLDGGVTSGDRGRIARSGAAVLEQAAAPERVVRIVDATDPDRLVGVPDADIELGAAIVAAACELDRTGRIDDVDEAARRVRITVGRRGSRLAVTV